jgi:hypothetical protein
VLLLSFNFTKSYLWLHDFNDNHHNSHHNSVSTTPTNPPWLSTSFESLLAHLRHSFVQPFVSHRELHDWLLVPQLSTLVLLSAPLLYKEAQNMVKKRLRNSRKGTKSRKIIDLGRWGGLRHFRTRYGINRNTWLMVWHRYESEFERVQDVFELQVKSKLWQCQL